MVTCFGGIIDLNLFLPSKASNIVKLYHQKIGRPYFPPFWALGYNQCRWGFSSMQ